MRDKSTTRIDIAGYATAADPWPIVNATRAQGAVLWHEDYGRWIVTTDRAVRKVLIDFQHLTVEGTGLEALFGADAFIAMDDRRRHDDLRGVWTEAFRKPALDRLRPQVESIVDALLAPVIARIGAGEAVDLVDALCRPLPTRIIALMMGVPDEAVADIVRWSDAMAAGGASYGVEAQAIADREAAKADLADYLARLLAERRRTGGDDLIARLAVAEIARGMSDDQLVQNLRQLLFAGNETTAKWLAHIFVTYGERPDDRRALVADRTLVPAANDEVMRWQGVVGTVVRKVRGGAIDVAGVTMADGDAVTCLIAAANRDPARYAEPDVFDIHRVPQPNLGFGVGFHNCLGSVLAKLEAEVAVDRLLDALPDYVLTSPPRYSALPLRGPSPVRLAHA